MGAQGSERDAEIVTTVLREQHDRGDRQGIDGDAALAGLRGQPFRRDQSKARAQHHTVAHLPGAQIVRRDAADRQRLGLSGRRAVEHGRQEGRSGVGRDRAGRRPLGVRTTLRHLHR